MDRFKKQRGLKLAGNAELLQTILKPMFIDILINSTPFTSVNSF